LFAGVGCGAAQSGTEDEITVGALVPTSGAFAEIGTDTKRGFELYAKQNGNELGGIPYNLVEGNEATEEPAETVRSAQRLIQEDQADVVFGVISSASALALRDVFDGQETPLIITNANVTEVSCENASPYVFRASYTFHQAGLIEGRWVAENVAKDGVYIIAPDYAGGRDLLAAFKRGFIEGGGSEDGIVGEAYPPFQQTDDYQPYLTRIKNSGAEHVFAFFGGAEAVTFLKQYEGFGLGDIPLYGHGSLADESILPALDRSVVGVTTFAPYSATLENPENEEFRRAYRREYDEEPTYFAAGAYIAAQMVAKAIEDNGGELPEDGEALSEALTEVGSFPAPLGEFRLVPETRNPIATFYVREVKSEGDALVNEVLGEAGTVEEACPS
jgi:branched-chain amino acid transport system substrate-binding protein